MTKKHKKRYRKRPVPATAPDAAGRAKRISARDMPQQRASAGGGVTSLLYAVLGFPFRVALAVIKRVAQVVFSVFFLILHPQFKWLLRLLLRWRLVRNYIRPALQEIADRLYHPYFVFLRRLPPPLATLSIAIPLAVLEPAKVYATVLIVEHPRTGIALWLFLQALSFVLIDKTWTAVRPQARKIWMVSRLHAWVWLTVSYGKYWVTSSPAYRAMKRWLAEARRAFNAFLARIGRRWQRGATGGRR